jgi:hypothetical protein
MLKKTLKISCARAAGGALATDHARMCLQTVALPQFVLWFFASV